MSNYVISYKNLERTLRAGEHYDFHYVVSAAMEALKEEVPDETLRTFIVAYLLTFETEQTIFKFDPAAVETPQMKEADRLRDEDFSFLDGRVKMAARYDPNPVRKAKAKLLLHIFRNYKQMRRKPYPEQTGWVWAVLKELDKPENRAIIVLLGLEDAVEAVREANGVFQGLWNERGHAYDEIRKLGTLSDARKQVYKSFGALVDFINALVLTGKLQGAEAQALALAIDSINAQIVSFARTLAHRGRKHKTDGPDPEGPGDPEEPGEPGEPEEPEEPGDGGETPGGGINNPDIENPGLPPFLPDFE